ncbi:hypothetical protein TGAM01_v201339 [Trichoderma gamsii]|uniref:GST N-terminal domain-containing protein n=1 Tax=Trichoderma gamsii TaxID=398673 RepID=A0A2P5A0D8_9HYPO|nr:hypothetical protein TGAM01_v201339 [Trichoderma gamsii]PON29973.1 hypothetical protein TGAM01_v201339 [Trichoderma gamsii]
MKLYVGNDTCARAAQLVANELDVRHELVYVDVLTKATSNGEDFATINPLLYVPALRLDNYDQDHHYLFLLGRPGPRIWNASTAWYLGTREGRPVPSSDYD